MHCTIFRTKTDYFISIRLSRSVASPLTTDRCEKIMVCIVFRLSCSNCITIPWIQYPVVWAVWAILLENFWDVRRDDFGIQNENLRANGMVPWATAARPPLVIVPYGGAVDPCKCATAVPCTRDAACCDSTCPRRPCVKFASDSVPTCVRPIVP